jgi:hypothetical protein
VVPTATVDAMAKRQSLLLLAGAESKFSGCPALSLAIKLIKLSVYYVPFAVMCGLYKI